MIPMIRPPETKVTHSVAGSTQGYTAGTGSSAGWFEGGEHVLPLRVYYEDTDAAGIVYYANYLKFAERARTEMMRCLGAEHRVLLEEAGIAFAVRSCSADSLIPARLDDLHVVRTRVEVRTGVVFGKTCVRSVVL